MKALLPLLIIPALLFSAMPKAQNYQNICSAGSSIYAKYDSSLKAFRPDAVEIPGGGDTVFISYPVIGFNMDQTGCFDTAMGSVLGRRILKKSDGWFYFFNPQGDTIRLKSNAAVGESWKFCRLSGSDWLQATCSSVVTENILGTNDLVKVIGFQAKNQSGGNIASLFNQCNIRLSQHFGLVRVFDMNFIISIGDTATYTLAGKSSPVMGLQEIGWKDVYRFEVGDEFHFQRDFNYISGGGTEKRIYRVLDRVVYGNWDSVRYQMQHCVSLIYGPPTTTYTQFDSIWTTYDLISLSTDSGITRLPDEFAPLDFYAEKYDAFKGFNGRLAKGITPWVYGRMENNCWTYLVGDGWTTYHYAKGLGKVITENNNLLSWNTDRLVYFRKGSEIWGTPVSNSCNTLVSAPGNNDTGGISVSVNPNPVHDIAFITVKGLRPDEAVTASVLDVSGKLGFRSTPFIEACRFERGSLPSGIYILILSASDSQIIHRSKLILF